MNVEKFCQEHIKGYYEITENGIGVDDDVNLIGKNLYNLPQFYYTGGYFTCGCNHLTDLQGIPSLSIGEYFGCTDNKVSQLIVPTHLDNHLSCWGNKITSLGKLDRIYGEFNCSNNELKSTKDIPRVDNGLWLFNNPLPQQLLKYINNEELLKQIIEYQVDFRIWNEDESLNIKNWNFMVKEMEI